MKIEIDGGFIEAVKKEDKIWLSIGCVHYNDDGTKKDIKINSAALSDEDLALLFFDIYPQKEGVEPDSEE